MSVQRIEIDMSHEERLINNYNYETNLTSMTSHIRVGTPVLTPTHKESRALLAIFLIQPTSYIYHRKPNLIYMKRLK